MLEFHPLRILDVQPDAEDAIAIALDVPEGLRSAYSGLPGQHVVLRAEVDGDQIRRTYSLTNAVGEWPLRIVARIHENGRMSRHLAGQLKAGDQVDVLPPNGSLTPRWIESPAAARPGRTYVGFAAGCGITPVVAVVEAVLRADPRNRFILFYGNTDTARVMCLEQLLGLKDRFIDRLALHFVMSREPQEIDIYNGHLDPARVRQLARTVFAADQVAEFFVCGPGDMIEQVSGVLRELNVAAERIHSEHFADAAGLYGSAEGDHSALVAAGEIRGGEASDPGGGAEASDRAPGGGGQVVGINSICDRASASDQVARAAQQSDLRTAEVTILMDGRRRTFTMTRDEDTVLDAAARAGLDLPFSCRAGVCSTCRTKVISGEVEMAQNYALEDWELQQGYVLACQSRVKTATLELDYDEK